MWSLLKAIVSLVSAVNELATATGNNTTATSLLSQRQFKANNLQIEANDLLAESNLLADQINEKLGRLLDRLSNLPDPDKISLLVTAEDGSMLTFKINLPAAPPEPNDIVGGELTVVIGTADPVVLSTTKDQTVVEGLQGNDGESVKASFAYLDDATPPNKSVHPSTIDVVLADTIPPADPGVLSLEVTGEE